MKLSEIEDRILALEHALSSLNLQQCPADPCHVHYAAEAEAEAEPKYDVTQEIWGRSSCGFITTMPDTTGSFLVCGCYMPEHATPDVKATWPQRRVLIAHAPEMYRVLSNLANGIPVGFGDARQLLAIIKKELQDNE